MKSMIRYWTADPQGPSHASRLTCILLLTLAVDCILMASAFLESESQNTPQLMTGHTLLFISCVVNAITLVILSVFLWPSKAADKTEPYLTWWGDKPEARDIVDYVVTLYSMFPEKRYLKYCDGWPHYRVGKNEDGDPQKPSSSYIDVFELFCTPQGRAKLKHATADQYMRGTDGFDPAQDLREEVRHLQSPQFWAELQQFCLDDANWLSGRGLTWMGRLCAAGVINAACA